MKLSSKIYIRDNRIGTNKSKNIILDIETFAIIFLTSSLFILRDTISSVSTIFLWVMLFVALAYRGRIISITKMIVPLVICFSYLSLFIFHEGFEIVGFKNFFCLCTVFLYTVCYDFDEIKESIIRVVKIITIISIPFFFIYFIFPDFYSPIQVVDSIGHRYSCWILFVNIQGVARNCGLFWEPGAFQAFINVALLLEVSKERINPVTIGILIVGCITTFSTVGYIATAFIIVLYLFKHTEFGNKEYGVAIVSILLSLIIVYHFRDIIFGSEQSSVFGKISTFFEYKEYNGVRHSSASTRYYSLILPIKAFKSSPIIGVGKSKLVEMTFSTLRGNFTCTFVNWLAIYGIVYASMIICGYLKFCKILFQKRKDILICFISLFILTAAEDFSVNAFFYIFPFAAFALQNKIRERNIKYDKPAIIFCRK